MKNGLNKRFCLCRFSPFLLSLLSSATEMDKAIVCQYDFIVKPGQWALLQSNASQSQLSICIIFRAFKYFMSRPDPRPMNTLDSLRHQYFKLPWVRPKPLRSKPAGNCSCSLAWSSASHLVLSELPICSSSSGQVGPAVSSPYSSGLCKMTFPICLLTLRLQA